MQLYTGIAIAAINLFQSSSTDHSGCNRNSICAGLLEACFNPHPLITVDATYHIHDTRINDRSFNPHPLITVDATQSWFRVRNRIDCFNPHPLITVDATQLYASHTRTIRCFNPHPLITVDATPKQRPKQRPKCVSILIH